MKEQKNKIYKIASISLCIIWLFFFFLPLNFQNVQAYKRIIGNTKKIKQWEEQGIKKGHNIMDQIEELKSSYLEIKNKLPSSLSQENILRVAKQLETKTKVVFTSIYFHEVESLSIQEGGMIKSQKVDLSFVATQEQLQRLINEMQCMEREISMEYFYFQQEQEATMTGHFILIFYGLEDEIRKEVNDDETRTPLQ
ncbi:MAG: hypothetical protein GX238_03195 [Epulopiscium sp.]|nr:hypothetical protein [Candidatus Epulonipiscium sp.]